MLRILHEKQTNKQPQTNLIQLILSKNIILSELLR